MAAAPRTDHAERWHVIDAAGPWANPVTLAEIAGRGEPTLLVGDGGLTAAAAAAGLTRAARLPAAGGDARWAVANLRRFFRSAGPVRSLHAWSPTAAAALRWAGLPSGARRTLHLTATPDACQLKRIGGLARGWDVQTASPRTARRLRGVGVETAMIDAMPARGVRPAADAHAGPARAALRARWGVDDDTPVVAAWADPPAAADTMRAAMTVNLVAEAAGRELRLLVHPLQHARARTQDLLDRYGHPDRLIQDAGLAAPWSVLSGLDAVMLGDDPAPLSVRYALAAGVPVVAPDTPDHRHAVGDAGVSYALTGEPKRLADRLLHGALGS
ncbi:MAG: hypothetical protein AAF710_09090 [Planctomycetota bacterium]